jgi:hypothetical protein
VVLVREQPCRFAVRVQSVAFRLDVLLLDVIPFVVTNARDNLQLSVDPSVPSTMRSAIESFSHLFENGQIVFEDQAAFERRSESLVMYNKLTCGGYPFEPILVAATPNP